MMYDSWVILFSDKGVVYQMNKRCYIVGAGEFCDKVLPVEGDYIIAADGGYAALESRGIMPDLIVGDFDSLGYVPDHPNVIRSPVEKDDTDMMLSIQQGLERGYDDFIINGGMGGRIDQTYANIQLLTYLEEKNASGTIVNNEYHITAIKNSEIRLSPIDKQNRLISVFCAGNIAKGVSLKGLKYPIENATITFENPIGVSNEFIEDTAVISVTDGTLIIFWNGKV